MTKDELRKYYFEIRNQLTTPEVVERSKAITQSITDSLLNGVDTIHIFVPIPNNNEVNTWELIRQCWQKNIQTATSITKFNPKRLEHSWFDKSTRFGAGKFEVPVPSPIRAVSLEELDLVIVPLLCVDEQGNRIGYGQGFYDSFLCQLPSSTRKVGVSLFEVHPEPILPDEWDVKLDGVVTPSGVFHFS